jgi:hypothetical protein
MAAIRVRVPWLCAVAVGGWPDWAGVPELLRVLLLGDVVVPVCGEVQGAAVWAVAWVLSIPPVAR